MSERKGDWIQTYSGWRFYPLDPRPEEIRIEDVAHALALQCRFAGHCSGFYSIAEHSVRVSRLCPPEDALWGLLHDASEAYLCDLPRPVKRDPACAAYRQAETRIMAAIALRFGLAPELPASVKQADEVLLATEARDLMGLPEADLGDYWPSLRGIEPLPRPTAWWPCSWMQAKGDFLNTFEKLTHGGDAPGWAYNNCLWCAGRGDEGAVVRRPCGACRGTGKAR